MGGDHHKGGVVGVEVDGTDLQCIVARGEEVWELALGEIGKMDGGKGAPRPGALSELDKGCGVSYCRRRWVVVTGRRWGCEWLGGPKVSGG